MVKKNRKCVIITAVAVVIIVVALSVSLSGRKGDGKEDEDDNPKIPGGATIEAAPENTIEAAPENTTAICSRENIETFQGRESCENICSNAECCFQTNGCFEDNEITKENCQTYTVCSILQLTEEVPFAPVELNEVCKISKLGENDRKACEELCESGSSCADTDVFNDNKLACASFAKCGILLTNIAMAPLEISEVCSRENLESNSESRDECEDICKGGACCTGIEEESCALENLVLCASYTPCGMLELTDPNSKIQLAPVDLIETCSRENVENAAGRTACKEMCEPSSCCVDPLEYPLRSCYIKHAIQCISYAPCEILDLTDPSATFPLAPSNLLEICSSTGNFTNVTDECVGICAPAECCFSSNEDNCIEEFFLSCLSYAPCVQVFI